MKYLAIDLGAGSGRAILGEVEGGRVSLREVLRFGNEPVMDGDVLRWDFGALMGNIRRGIELAGDVRGVAVDTWGVDFGLLDDSGGLMFDPVCYRDSRTRGMMGRCPVSSEDMYAVTGIQQMEINTLYQLLAAPPEGASRLLFMPDLINYMLTGVAVSEYTIASTSQLLDARGRGWSCDLIDGLGLPRDIFCDIIRPGSVIGTLSGGAKVFAVGSHDTASAIAAIPADGDDWAFLSSGTWSLLGVALDGPVFADPAFTNEGGVDGKVLHMRNITGLWLLQRLILEWGEVCYDDLLAECERCEPLRSLVDVDEAAFTMPASMSAAIAEFCERTGQPVPRSRGEFVRCVLESLALKYKAVAADIAVNTGREIRRLFVVGGGSKNRLLNQWVADALGVEVVVGLEEGTATGNIMQQAIADGAVRDWHHAHRIIAACFPAEVYAPRPAAAALWDAARLV